MPLITIEQIRRTHLDPEGGRLLVLDVPLFALEPGELLGIHGASGSGKTTLLEILAGILVPDSGSVVIDGQDLTKMREAARDRFRARHIGFVHQSFNLLDGFSAFENVLLPTLLAGAPDRDRARALLVDLGLERRLAHRPHQLSIGQRQRVALARALVTRPLFVLADEPTGSLDPIAARAAALLLAQSCRESGAALIMVSHDHETLEHCDRTCEFSVINRVAAEQLA